MASLIVTSFLKHVRGLALPALVAAGAALMGGVSPAVAQLADTVDRAGLNEWRLGRGNQLAVCHFRNSTMADFEIDLANHLAARLLLTPRLVELNSDFGIDGAELEQALYTALINECDMILGIRVGTTVFPAEFTVARPYVALDYVMVVKNPEYRVLGDIPRGRRLGSPMGTWGDLALARYVSTRPANDSWLRLPYGDHERMLTRLADGTIEAMMLFGPVYADMIRRRPADTAGLSLLELPQELSARSQLGALMLSRDRFVRMEVDRAIEDMQQDGTIRRLLDDNGLGMLPVDIGAN